MNMKPSIAITGLVLVCGLATLWYGKLDEQPSADARSEPAAALHHSSADAGTPSPATETRVPQLVSEGSRNETRQAMPMANERQLSDGRHFIQFSTAEARNLALYDTFEIRLDNGSLPATGRVEKVTEFEGIRRVSGSFRGPQGQDQDQDHNNVFSITVSSDGSYAAGNFLRNGKSYGLESKSGAGWITHADTGAQSLHQSADMLR
jgi:hypothetical protein